MRRARAVAAIAALALSTIPAAARGNGRFPAAGQLAIAPTDPSLLVLRTTYGLVVSRDGGATWDWVCERAIGTTGNEDPFVGVTGGRALVVGTSVGLALSPDTGCTWRTERPGKFFADVAVRPDAPATALALLSAFDTVVDGGDRFDNEVLVSRDDGQTWSPLGTPLDPASLPQTLEAAKSDPRRLYVSATRGSGATAAGVLFVSSDEGATWEERAIPLDPTIGERAPFIGAVDPRQADTVYVRTGGQGVSRLLVTRDAGRTWTVALQGKALAGFALSPDGAKVYAGGVGDGLLVADATDLRFERRASFDVQCLAASEGRLYACSNERGGFLVGESRDDGATFVAKLHLCGAQTMRGPMSCGAGTRGADCANDWAQTRTTLGQSCEAASDAGSLDAGPAPSPPESSSCGCTTGRSGVDEVIATAALALLTLMGVRGLRRAGRRA